LTEAPKINIYVKNWVVVSVGVAHTNVVGAGFAALRVLGRSVLGGMGELTKAIEAELAACLSSDSRTEIILSRVSLVWFWGLFDHTSC
jgi:hypothetical protein